MPNPAVVPDIESRFFRELTERDAERMAREDQRVRQRGRMDEESLAKLDRDLRHEPDPAREDGNG